MKTFLISLLLIGIANAGGLDYKYCAEFKLYDQTGSQIARTKCDILQSLDMEDGRTKWACKEWSYEEFINFEGHPHSLDFDYSMSAVYSEYLISNETSFGHLLLSIGLPTISEGKDYKIRIYYYDNKPFTPFIFTDIETIKGTYKLGLQYLNYYTCWH